MCVRNDILLKRVNFWADIQNRTVTSIPRLYLLSELWRENGSYIAKASRM